MSISLTRSEVPASGIIAGNRHSWPLQVVAVSTTEGLSSEIFVYHVGASDGVAVPGDPYPGDRCEAIASVHQMQELPVGTPPAPGVSSRVPFYRADTAFFYCHSLEEADRVWGIIQSDTQDLLENFLAAGNLEETEEVLIEPVVVW